MAHKAKHWVEELFAPRFTTQDLFFETLEPDLLQSEKVAKERTRTVEGIYQAALCKLQEDEKQKRKKSLSKMIIRDYEPSAQNIPATAQSNTCTSCLQLNSNTQCTVGDNKCIWSEHELNLLRHELDKKHSEGAQLKLQLNACKLDLSKQKAKQKETEQELEAVRAELAASKRYTECKMVLLKHIQEDDKKKDAELQFLKKDLQDKAVMLHTLTNSLHKARKDIQELQLENSDFEYELKSLRQQQGLENIFALEKMKMKFGGKVNMLRKEIECVKSERDKQRDQFAIDVLASK